MAKGYRRKKIVEEAEEMNDHLSFRVLCIIAVIDVLL